MLENLCWEAKDCQHSNTWGCIFETSLGSIVKWPPPSPHTPASSISLITHKGPLWSQYSHYRSTVYLTGTTLWKIPHWASLFLSTFLHEGFQRNFQREILLLTYWGGRNIPGWEAALATSFARLSETLKCRASVPKLRISRWAVQNIKPSVRPSKHKSHAYESCPAGK